MKRIIINITSIALCGVLFSCSQNEVVSTTVEITPWPVAITQLNGELSINSDSKIITTTEDESLDYLAQYTQEMIEDRTGLKLECSDQSKYNRSSITFRITPESKHDEGYKLNISRNGVEISASTKRGLLYGVQSLRQLLPLGGDGERVKLPYLKIEDYPRFEWRGLHLDVSRHFFDREEVKRFLDLMAMYKLNVFHWHLTDDQGWRVEIKRHPKLTSIGAWRKSIGFTQNQTNGLNSDDGSVYGGYYTHEDIRDIVDYASNLGITVVPEIDLPGHSMAVLCAYPELYCFDDKEELEIWTKGGVSNGVYCAGNERSFEVIEDIFDEIIELFPSEMIHLGGDEAPKHNWKKCARCQERIREEGLNDEYELQSYFINRVAEYITSKGRKVVGWDEIMEGKGVDDATIMAWRGIVPGVEAAEAGHQVVMTPSKYLYISRPQSINDVTKAKGGVLSMREVYEYEPIPAELQEKYHHHIIGLQACQWSENTPNQKVLEYKEYPRAIALAEVAWTQKERKEWSHFYNRMINHNNHLLFYGVEGGARSYDVGITISPSNNESTIDIGFKTEVPDEVYYTLDGEEPTINSAKTTSKITIDKSCVINACMFRPDGSKGQITTRDIHFHKALGKEVTYVNNYSANYDGGGDYGLTNGVFEMWQGFEKQDVNVIVDLGRITNVSEISTNWYYDIADWVLRPRYVTYEGSIDGENYTLLHTKVIGNPIGLYDKGIITINPHLNNTEMRYIRVRAESEKVNPKWHTSAGGASWVFIDEIKVN